MELNERNNEIMNLAVDLSEFYDDFDPYGFSDAYSNYGEDSMENAIQDNYDTLCSSDYECIIDGLTEIVEELCPYGEPSEEDRRYIKEASVLLDRVNALSALNG